MEAQFFGSNKWRDFGYKGRQGEGVEVGPWPGECPAYTLVVGTGSEQGLPL